MAVHIEKPACDFIHVSSVQVRGEEQRSLWIVQAAWPAGWSRTAAANQIG
ncbi:MAG: MbtH family NRPS accessory protein [Anaerolineales bacterium]|nr:MbtH family NRPS accessory protein [Anaerolineales bacterium]